MKETICTDTVPAGKQETRAVAWGGAKARSPSTMDKRCLTSENFSIFMNSFTSTVPNVHIRPRSFY